MNCPRCGRAMRETRRSHHKKRKWVCPNCRRVRMQAGRPKSTRPGESDE